MRERMVSWIIRSVVIGFLVASIVPVLAYSHFMLPEPHNKIVVATVFVFIAAAGMRCVFYVVQYIDNKD